MLDVLNSSWPGVPATLDAIFCANMLHIAPWPVCGALMRGAARHLVLQGQLILYGPYFVDGEPTEDPAVMADPARYIHLLMQGGRVVPRGAGAA